MGTNIKTQDLRSISLEPLLRAHGFEHDSRKGIWKNGDSIISATGPKFFDHTTQRGGGGAVDLVMNLRSLPFGKALAWLRRFTVDGGGVDAIGRASDTYHAVTDATYEPISRSEHAWPKARKYLIEERGLSSEIVDACHAVGIVFAHEREVECEYDSYKSRYLGTTCDTYRVANVGFQRLDFEGKEIGATLRGTIGEFKQTLGRKADGCFAIGDSIAPGIVFVTESPIDALSLWQLRESQPDILVLSQDGAGHGGVMPWIDRFPQAMIACSHDADAAGNEMAKMLALDLEHRDCVRWPPKHGKDWSEELAFPLPLFSSK